MDKPEYTNDEIYTLVLRSHGANHASYSVQVDQGFLPLGVNKFMCGIQYFIAEYESAAPNEISDGGGPVRVLDIRTNIPKIGHFDSGRTGINSTILCVDLSGAVEMKEQFATTNINGLIINVEIRSIQDGTILQNMPHNVLCLSFRPVRNIETAGRF